MKQFLAIFLLFFVYSQPGFSAENWSRHVFTETRDDGAQLLLVIDVPNNPKLLQNVVYRHIFKINQKSQLEEKKEFFFKKNTPDVLKEHPITNSPLWPIKQNFWTEENEKDFSTWVESVKKDFLVGSGIRVDCADFYITLRWIYSHDHNLPVANTLSGSNMLFGSWQSTEEWDALPSDLDWRKDARFKAALHYLLDNTYTHSLIHDLYPIALNKDFISPGAVYLVLKNETGHTQPIKVVGKSTECTVPEEGCILTIWGNEPADEKVFLSAPYFFPPKSPNTDGFFRYRWPILTEAGWKLAEGATLPGYSLEQYQYSGMPYIEFENLIFEKVGLGGGLISRAIQKGLAIDENLKLRLNITALGFFICHMQSCPKGSDLYNTYSTPGRDQRIRDLQRDFLELMKQINTKDPRWIHFAENVGNKYLMWLDHLSKNYLLKNYIFEPELMNNVSSDPNDDYLKRWGLPAEYSRAETILHPFIIAWEERVSLVKQAQTSCNETNCDPSLNTRVLDNGMKLAYREMINYPPTSKIEEHAKYFDMGITLCPWNQIIYFPPNACVLYDYIYSNRNLIENMTSNPHDSYNSRFGFFK